MELCLVTYQIAINSGTLNYKIVEDRTTQLYVQISQPNFTSGS